MNFYLEASRCLDRLDAKRGSIKGIISGLPPVDRSRGAALIIETLKYRPALTTIIENSALLQEEKKQLKSKNLALLLVHDLLFARGIQAGDGPIKKAVLRHKARLQAELARLKVGKGVTSNTALAIEEDERAAMIPRYARVNACLWNLDDSRTHFASRDYSLITGIPTKEDEYAIDSLIPNLLVFHRDAKLHEDGAYLSGKLILQEKASCMPAVVLNPPASHETMIIDATAAPGNKTSHLSAIMQNKGKIFAFERDKARFATLQRTLSKAGCTNVTPTHADFMTVDPQNDRFATVTHIMLDPSCSGSGIVNRLDYLVENDEEDISDERKRLAKLAEFQAAMIIHAMKFPSARYIEYSTCSVHAEENEEVVAKALESECAIREGFVLASRKCVLPDWPRRGLQYILGENAEKVVRCNPGTDKVNGFFVALFVRKAVAPTAGIQSHKRKIKHSDSPSGKRRKP